MQKDGDENPRFPIVKHPGGEKEECRHDDRKLDKPACRFNVQIPVHVAVLKIPD
jgi:hypothetical protein